MKSILLIITSVLLTGMMYGQYEAEDRVIMKDEGVHEGIIIEQKPGEHIKILRIPEKDTLTITLETIDRIEKILTERSYITINENLKDLVNTPYPPAPQQPGTPPVSGGTTPPNLSNVPAQNLPNSPYSNTPGAPASPAVPGTQGMPVTPPVYGTPPVPAVPAVPGVPAAPGVPPVPGVPPTPPIPGTPPVPPSTTESDGTFAENYNNRDTYIMLHGVMGGGDYAYQGFGFSAGKRIGAAWQMGLSIHYMGQTSDNTIPQRQTFPLAIDIRRTIAQSKSGRTAALLSVSSGYNFTINGDYFSEKYMTQAEIGNGFYFNPALAFRFNTTKNTGLMVDVGYQLTTGGLLDSQSNDRLESLSWSSFMVRGSFFF